MGRRKRKRTVNDWGGVMDDAATGREHEKSWVECVGSTTRKYNTNQRINGKARGSVEQ